VTDQPEVSPDQKAQANEQASAGQPVIRDKRRVKAPPTGDKAKVSPPAADAETGKPQAAAAGGGAEDTPTGTAGGASVAAGDATPGAESPASDTAAPERTEPVAPEEPAVEPEPEPVVSSAEAPGGFAAELEAVRAELDERTRDLQRLSAEYANYRKRVERDRALIGEQATASVLSALLPVLDDLDRAREHDELPEGVSAVVDQLVAITRKFGLTPFGEQGDPFDPNRHEAVAHRTSADVWEPTCVDVLRRGYLLGDRLLRPAMVAVADPE
jgi:molecular chaperone GrpE